MKGLNSCEIVLQSWILKINNLPYHPAIEGKKKKKPSDQNITFLEKGDFKAIHLHKIKIT